jgi:maleylacetate reductase
MEPFVHEQLAQRVVFGWDRLGELPAEVDRLGARRPLLISERSTAWIADRVTKMLDLAGKIGPARPHVPAQDAEDARAEAGRIGADLVITIGGGSATGLGKNVALDGIPLLAIPTTYAGSEATAIHGTSGGGRKRTGKDVRALPRTIIYDPSLTTTLPARVTAATGMNALAHCIEALYAENRTPVTTLLAHEGIRSLARALPLCIDDPDSRTGRSQALFGAYLAGSVLAMSGMAIHHRICHVLGGALCVSHGDANSAVLPHVVAYNEPAARDEMERVARTLEAKDAAAGLYDLAAGMGAPTSLRELGVGEHDLEHVADLVLEGDFTNPRAVDRPSLMDLLRRIHRGERPTT